MFHILLKSELERRNLSLREAAQEIGISHSTLAQAVKGVRKLDVETALALSRWLQIPITSIIFDSGDPDQKRRSAIEAIDIILRAAPELELTFIDMAEELQKGTFTLGDFNDVINYAVYRIQTRREQALANDQRRDEEEIPEGSRRDSAQKK